MNCLKFVVLVALAKLAAAEVNITLSADGTHFEISGSDDADDSLTRVINGHPARPAQFPWHATIFVQRAQDRWNFASGTLLTRNWVVTTGTSTRGSRETRVFLGSNSFGHGQQIFSQQTVRHPRFHESRLFDIAVIELNRPAQLGGAVQPIPVSTWTNSRFEGEYVRFSGFGSESPTRPFRQLQWAELRVTREAFCRQAWPNAVGPFFFCAMNNRQTSARPGFGDIGAGLVMRTNNGVRLIGMTIAGSPNSRQQGGLSGFLNLARHSNWLNGFR